MATAHVKLNRDTITYNAGRRYQAWRLLMEMTSAQEGLKYITRDAAVACEKGGRWYQAIRLSVAIASALLNLNRDTITFSAAVNACEKGGQCDQVLTSAQVGLNIITYHAAVSACEKGGQWYQA